MTVYVLIPQAVYDHGVIGVYSTEALARAAAEDIWPQTDGHHSFRIEPRMLDQTCAEVFQYRVASTLSRKPGPAPVELLEREEAAPEDGL